MQYQPKAYQFSWQPVADAAYYELSEDPDGEAGPQPASTVGGQISDAQYTLSLADQLLTERINASYRVRACTASGCGAYSDALTPDVSQAIGYFKASNTDFSDTFGLAVALSADGSTLAVGAPAESGLVTGVNGDQTNNVGDFVGAVYVYTRTPSGWQQQAYVKPSNARQYDTPNGTAAMFQFGTSLALSADGHTLAVGAPAEPSNARGVNGDQSNASTPGAGAVYVFKHANGAWVQQSYLKASNTEASAEYTGGLPWAGCRFGRPDLAVRWLCRQTGAPWQ